MENLKLITSSRRLMALAALATGVALPPQSIMAASTAQVVQQSGVVKGQPEPFFQQLQVPWLQQNFLGFQAQFPQQA